MALCREEWEDEQIRFVCVDQSAQPIFDVREVHPPRELRPFLFVPSTGHSSSTQVWRRISRITSGGSSLERSRTSIASGSLSPSSSRSFRYVASISSAAFAPSGNGPRNPASSDPRLQPP